MLDELEKKARAVKGPGVWWNKKRKTPLYIYLKDDVEFIAEANPEMVLKLIALAKTAASTAYLIRRHIVTAKHFDLGLDNLEARIDELNDLEQT